MLKSQSSFYLGCGSLHLDVLTETTDSKETKQPKHIRLGCLLDYVRIISRKTPDHPPQPKKAQCAAYKSQVPQRPCAADSDMAGKKDTVGRPWTTSPLALSKRTANLLLAFGIPMIVWLIRTLSFCHTELE